MNEELQANLKRIREMSDSEYSQWLIEQALRFEQMRVERERKRARIERAMIVAIIVIVAFTTFARIVAAVAA